MTGLLPRTQRGVVLAGVKTPPSGWPTASLDPGCGRRPNAPSGSKLKITKSQISGLYGLRGLPTPAGSLDSA